MKIFLQANFFIFNFWEILTSKVWLDVKKFVKNTENSAFNSFFYPQTLHKKG